MTDYPEQWVDKNLYWVRNENSWILLVDLNNDGNYRSIVRLKDAAIEELYSRQQKEKPETRTPNG